MSRSLNIHPWLSDVELLAWTQDAKTRPEYQRRLTIWLAYLEHWPAHRIARALGLSVPAIWRWVSQYNQQGPGGLERAGRGGRRWAFLSLEQERQLLAEMQKQAGGGQVLTAKQLMPRIRQVTGRKVSLDYVYRLLHRHGWRKLAPRPAHVKADPMGQEAFKKTPHKSSRKH
jgi:transposase